MGFLSDQVLGNEVDISAEDINNYFCAKDIISLPEVPPLPDMQEPFTDKIMEHQFENRIVVLRDQIDPVAISCIC